MDTIKGFLEATYTLNEYGYCWNNLMALVDLDGAWPQWMEDVGGEIKDWVKDNIGISNVEETRLNVTGGSWCI